MHLRPFIGCAFLTPALLLSPLHAQTDHPSSTTPVTRAIAVYEYTGDLTHPTAAHLIPVSLFIHSQLQDAGVYLPQPVPFALQPGTLYLIQRAGETVGAINIQSAHTNPTPTAPAWAAYGRFLTPTEATAAPTPTQDLSSFAVGGGPASPSSAQSAGSHDNTAPPSHNKKKKQPKEQASVTPPNTPILDDPDRPILAATPPDALATIPELTTLPPDLHQTAAVSDAANRAPETFTTTWPSPTIRDQTLQALEALALPHLTHYIAFNHLTPAPTNKLSSFAESGGSASSSSSEPSRKQSTPTLIHTQLLAYTLTPGDTPTYILTAESPLTTNGPIYLTLIAQPDAAGHLHPTLISITDATHLDRTPWLRPIDAVDPDATGRANLLFELRSQTTRHFALYDVTTTPPRQVLLTTTIDSPPAN